MSDPNGPVRCPACDGELHEIKLIDLGDRNVPRPLEYAPADSERSFWTGRLPTEGRIAGLMCGDCGLISFYGVSKA